ncbi:hypothetical protein H8959_016190 [Pygathrix nigripes]
MGRDSQTQERPGQLCLSSQFSYGGAGRFGSSPRRCKISIRPTLRRPAAPHLPRSPLPWTAAFLTTVPNPLRAFPQTPLLGASLLPVTRDPGHPRPSYLPRTGATPSSPAPHPPPRSLHTGRGRASRVPLLPDTQAVLGTPETPRPRSRSLQVTPFSGTLAASVSSDTYSPHTGRRSAPQTGAAGRPKGPPALTRVGPALAYLPRENSAARSPAILPLAQSARTRRHPRRLRPGPGPGPDPKSRPSSSGLRLRSAELEIPPRDGPQISDPRYWHSPAAAPDQLKLHCLYLGRQWPPSATTSPMTTGPPSFILLTYPLDNGAAVLLSDWLSLPARHLSLPPLFLNPVFAPARTWSGLAQALVVIG